MKSFILAAQARGTWVIEVSEFVFGILGMHMVRTRLFKRGQIYVRAFGISVLFLCAFLARAEQASCTYSLCEVKTPAAWYALGSEAYKKGEYAQACCLWQRACAVGGNAMVRERCAHNCKCAYKKLGLNEPVVSWWQRISNLFAQLPLFFLQILFLVIFYGALLFIYRGRRQRITRVRSAAFFAVLVIISGLLLMNRYLSDARALGVVVQDQQVLYAGPGSDYPERGCLTCGQTVELCDLRGEWYKVHLSAREIGWIPRAALMSVKP